MNKYTGLKSKHEKMINAFPMAFAFSDEQFQKAMDKLQVKGPEELLSIPAGGMIRKADKAAYHDMMMIIDNETKEALSDDKYLYEAFYYELGNHEFIITFDYEPTLSCLGLTLDEIRADKRMSKILIQARDEYIEACEKWEKENA